MVWNPGQGHLPVLLGRMAGRIDRMTLISRDALALHQSAVNVAKNECCSEVHQEHRVGFTSGTGEKNVDLCVGMINDKEGLEINVKKITQVRNIYGNVPLFLGTPISFGLRLEKALRKEKIKALMVKKHQGNGVLECE
jgi:hypothetical protein